MNAKDGRICAGIWSEHHLTKTFHELMALGPRLLGSPGEKRAQEFLADRVDMLELKEATMLTGRILLSLADAPSLPVCHQPPPSAS